MEWISPIDSSFLHIEKEMPVTPMPRGLTSFSSASSPSRCCVSRAPRV